MTHNGLIIVSMASVLLEKLPKVRVKEKEEKILFGKDGAISEGTRNTVFFCFFFLVEASLVPTADNTVKVLSQRVVFVALLFQGLQWRNQHMTVLSHISSTFPVVIEPPEEASDLFLICFPVFQDIVFVWSGVNFAECEFHLPLTVVMPVAPLQFQLFKEHLSSKQTIGSLRCREVIRDWFGTD